MSLQITENPTTAFTDSKPHYVQLDALRGVAALLVVWYHVFEGFQFASGADKIEAINHGYLAVDFFFVLSGFVISYAYDSRWGKTLTTPNFFKRRLVRLHPMVIMGAVIGVCTFLMQGSVQWDGTHIATSSIMLALLCMMFFVPAVPGCRYEIRGNGEMFPLNGPAWSLFFEYLGNIIYALFIRRLSTRNLKILTVLLALMHIIFSAGNLSGYGMIGVGWTLDATNFFGGLLRMLCPFTIGMLVSRTFHKVKVKNSFIACSILLIFLFHIPYINDMGGICMNGVFESFCVVIVFPIIVLLGATSDENNSMILKICRFLGNISFPLYITHYPVMYLFYSWLIDKKLYTLGETWPRVTCTYLLCIAIAYLCYRFYDVPLRKWLAKKLKM